MNPTPRRLRILLVLLILGVATPALASLKSRITDLFELATGGVVASVERIKPLERVGDPVMPLAIKVPAGNETRIACKVVANVFQCFQVVVEFCPHSLVLMQGESSFSCDLDCHGNTPDASGECECDIKYDTCTPFP